MNEAVSTGTWRLRAAAAVTAVVALTALGIWFFGSPSSSGPPAPLEIKAGNTEVVFPAPPSDPAWSAMVGGLLLCAPGKDVTVTHVAPLHGIRAGTFTSHIRVFTIQRSPAGQVGEPFIGGYGAVPWIGGQGHPHEDRLIGDIETAAGATLVPPPCEDTTSAPGEDTVELIVGLTAQREGAAFDGVAVEYASEGHHYRTRVDVRVTLCGTEATDPDC